MNTSPTAKIEQELRRLSEAGEDISPISTTLNQIKSENTARIVKGLRGVADLALMAKSTARRFVLVIWKDNEAMTCEGIDFGYGQVISEKEEDDAYRVFIFDDDASMGGMHYTVGRLKKGLEESGTPYAFEYRPATS